MKQIDTYKITLDGKQYDIYEFMRITNSLTPSKNIQEKPIQGKLSNDDE